MQHIFSPPQHVAVSSGSGQADLEKLCSILEAIPLIKYICLDVANGYSEHFVEFVKTVRGKFPNHTIMVREPSQCFPKHKIAITCCSVLKIQSFMSFWTQQAGNVVTGEMVEELILSGADIIKVGIGPGVCHGSFSFFKLKTTTN